MPPPSRNHRSPVFADTPTVAAARSVDAPSAISLQNLRSNSFGIRRRPIDTTPHHGVLHRPLEPEHLMAPSPYDSTRASAPVRQAAAARSRARERSSAMSRAWPADGEPSS